jgi:uncharacterized membrane protein
VPTITLDHEVEVSRPISDVFDFLSDHERLPAWTAGVKRVTRTSPAPIGAGTTYQVVAKMLGRRVRFAYEITSYEPDKQFAGRMTSPILSFEETYRFEAGEDGRTVVRLNLEAQPLGWLRLLGPVLAVGIHRQIPADHRRLCAILERSRRPRARAGGTAKPQPDPGRQDEAGQRDTGE